jgi:hypothetical protein
MRILIEMVDAVCVEKRGTTFNTVHFVALLEQKFGEIGAVLSGDTSY